MLYAHQLAWFIVHGAVPTMGIDHKNQNKLDNSADNLRSVPMAINQRNCRLRVDNSSGECGVIWYGPSKKWRVQVNTNGVRHHLGTFATKEDAASAAKAFRLANGFTDLHGKPSPPPSAS